MSQQQTEQTIDIEERLLLVKAFPCFAQFTAAQYTELAKIMDEKQYEPGQIIVTENNLVDSVYIIASGAAEVTRTSTHRKKTVQVPVAVLHAGEAIGLNDTGFYSSTGKRTATVTAVTMMVLLHLDIKELYSFLKKYNLELSMYTASLQMMRMRLIKQSLPFGKISHERLQWLAEHVEELTLPAGTILFNEGDVGDKCYLIRSGKIEVIAQEDGQPHQLAILKAPVLFGEATMITHARRNATARVIEDAELFSLSHEHLTELIESESNVAKMFMTLMLDRSRPMQNEHVTVHQRTTADGQELTILKNPDNGAYFKLSKEGYFIWQHLDGKHTMQDITLTMAEEFQLFAPNVVAALISKLTQSNFVSNVDIESDMVKSKQSWWMKGMMYVQKIMSLHVAIKNTDNWITKTYNKYMWIFFTRIGKIISIFLIIMGFAGLYLATNQTVMFFHAHKMGLLMLVMIYPLSAISLIFHELAHAYAVKSAGREVRHIGIGWSFSGPIAFTDTSDMWLSARRARIAVNVAGVYADALFCSLCVLLIFIIPNPYIQGFLWVYALYAYVDAFRELSPLQELDGYYILMDSVEKNHLRQHAVVWLVKKFPKCLRKPSLFKENKAEVIYWIVCISYLVLVSIVTLMLQRFIFEIMGYHAPNPFITLLAPLGVVIFTAIGIVAEIKNQAEE